MKISVVMTSYNYATLIGEAIESVINQTYKDWELIIVDDASTDNSIEVIKKYLSDKRIKLFVNEKNLGLAKTLQRGIKEATSEWIAFLESDDKFSPNALEEKAKAIETGADLIFTDLEMFGDTATKHNLKSHFNSINKYFIKISNPFIENFPSFITKMNVIPTFSVVMTKKSLLLSCKYNPICKSNLDYYLWAQLSNYRIYYLNKKLTYWRMHKDSYLNRENNNWLKKYLFSVTIYASALNNTNKILKFLKIVNYARARLIYLKLDKDSIKLNMANNRFIFEKKFR